MITPTADEPLQKLLLYLKTEMNVESQAYTGQDAVAGTREFQTDLNTVDRFPLLMGYRNRYLPNGVCDLTIEWFVAAAMDLENNPGHMNWGIRKIIELLADSSEAIANPCLQIREQNITGEIRFGQAREGGLLVPFARVIATGVVDLD